ncbi:MAG: SpoIIE family protein phosphatase [Bacteroidales bacterium]|nr:SpoIIE family protein phosphatase [Bacteroidales bacterium]
MKINKITHKNSISGRLTLRVLIVSAVIFTLTFTAFVRMAANKVRQEATKHAHSELSNTVHQIDAVLKAVETAVENTAWLVPYRLSSPDFMYAITERLLQNNSFICGSAVAFEPDYYATEGHYFSPYSYRDENGKICSKQLGSDTYDYHYMDWYQIPKLLNESYWSEPYYDDGGGEMMMTTYSKPLYDEFGNLYAVITADLSLEWLTELVGNIHAFDNSFNLMVSRNASYIVHPNHDLILNETIYSSTYGDEDESLKKMQYDMVHCKAGEVLRDMPDGKYFVFYSPVETTCWSVAVVCPRSELYLGVKILRGMLIIIGVIALLLMIFLSYYGIRKIVAPVEDFSGVAKQIARGDFNAELPQIQSEDELKELHDSFEYLQKSLVKYIDELKSTTANKERIESELRIARSIQMGMIPKSFPAFPDRDDVSLVAKLVPAKEVGGDLYDFFIEKDKLYFIIGDVSGKGIPASLVMAVTCRLFRSVASYLDKPEEIITSLNNSLADGNDSNMFCTAFLGILDLKTGSLLYCNAGHNAPYVIEKDGKVSAMSVTPNLPLGLFSGFPYEGQETRIEKDMMIYMFTDGVNEAENNEKEQYSDERLISLLKKHSADTPKVIVDETFAQVEQHADGADQSDDITVMCIKYC